MAIQIQQNLTVTPSPTTLPRRVDFQQSLLSDQPAEKVTVTYSLAPAHDVWFEEPKGQLTKAVTRSDTVAGTGTVCRDRIMVVRGPGNGPMVAVQIDQTVTDSAGVALPDVCTLLLT